MDTWKDIKGAEPGHLLSVSVQGGLHVVGIVESVDHENRQLTFKGGRVLDIPADPEPEPEEGQEKDDAS